MAHERIEVALRSGLNQHPRDALSVSIAEAAIALRRPQRGDPPMRFEENAKQRGRGVRHAGAAARGIPRRNKRLGDPVQVEAIGRDVWKRLLVWTTKRFGLPAPVLVPVAQPTFIETRLDGVPGDAMDALLADRPTRSIPHRTCSADEGGTNFIE